MVERQYSKSLACRKAVQYLVAIAVTFVIGKIVASVSLFSDTELFRSLTSAELVSFVTKMAVLVLIFVFTKHLMNAMEGTGSGIAFLRGVSVPFATLLIVVIAQQSVRELLSPFLGSPANTTLTMLSTVAVLATALWVIFTVYRYSPLLFDFFVLVGKELRSRIAGNIMTKTCFNCASPIEDSVKYCPSCGIELSSARCRHCQAVMTLPGKYCGQCGHLQQPE